jgi:DNA-binding XRE family transcriptional regulator
MKKLIEYKIHPLKVFRITHDLTQKELAKMVGVNSPEPIISIERGRRWIPHDLAEKIEEISGGKLKKEVLAFLDPAEFNRDNDQS